LRRSFFDEIADEKGEKAVSHKIGYCSICGWVHRRVDRVRREETLPDGKTAFVIRPLCIECQKSFAHLVDCDVCGRTECDNLYPVSIMTKRFDKEGHSCNIFVHMCSNCRKIPHSKVLEKLNIPNMCDSCNDRFLCFTSLHMQPYPSEEKYGDDNKFHRNIASKGYRRR